MCTGTTVWLLYCIPCSASTASAATSCKAVPYLQQEWSKNRKFVTPVAPAGAAAEEHKEQKKKNEGFILLLEKEEEKKEEVNPLTNTS